MNSGLDAQAAGQLGGEINRDADGRTGLRVAAGEDGIAEVDDRAQLACGHQRLDQ